MVMVMIVLHFVSTAGVSLASYFRNSCAIKDLNWCSLNSANVTYCDAIVILIMYTSRLDA